MTTGGSWIDPVHDLAGNMTTIHKPAALDEGFTAIYDAWNRLVKLETLDGQQTITVAEYEYDGQNQRIVKNTYASGSLAEVRHFYYNDRWKCIEEWRERATPPFGLYDYPEYRYFWGVRYVDELILRQRDTDANGSLDETLHALQDANFNVVALADTGGLFHYWN